MAKTIEVSQAPIQEKFPGIDQALVPKARPPFAHPRTREFLQAVIAEDGTIIPEELRAKPEGRIRAREQNLIGSYYSSQATLDELGKIYRDERTDRPITYEWVRKIIKRGMRRLWENSSDKVKEAFPWDTIPNAIPLRKPLTLKSRIKFSLARGGRSLKVLAAIQQGQDYRQLRSGRSRYEIAGSRNVLRRWEFTGEIPFVRLAGEARRLFIEKLDAAQTPEAVQELFKQIEEISPSNIASESTLPLTKLGDILLACGFNPRDSKNKHIFIEVLRANGIIVGHTEKKVKSGPQTGNIQRYYFIRNKDIPHAEKILRSSPLLARFKIQKATNIRC